MARKGDEMASYSVAEAKDSFSSLIAKAEAGEEVIITRRGKPTVEIKAVAAGERPAPRGLDWLQAELAKLPPMVNDGPPLAEQMRAEYRY